MRFSRSVVAPFDQNSLAGYEQLGVFQFDLTNAQQNIITNQTPSYGVAPGTGPLLQGSQPIPTTSPTFLQSFGSFVGSDAFKNLFSAGAGIYGGYQQQKDAKAMTRVAEQRAATEAQLAQAQIELARSQQAAHLEAAKAQQGGAAGGLPSWALPAGLAAAGLVVVLLITKKK